MKAFFAEFKKFISRGNVVDMAVGVAVATAFTKIVTAFTNGFITPLLALLTNNADLSDMKWIIKEAVTDAEGVVTQKEVAFMWGSFVQAIIDFLIIALVLFTVMKIFNRTMERARELQNELMTSPEAKKKAEEEHQNAEEQKVAEPNAEVSQKRKPPPIRPPRRKPPLLPPPKSRPNWTPTPHRWNAPSTPPACWKRSAIF